MDSKKLLYIVSGPRRCGKSTLINDFIQKLTPNKTCAIISNLSEVDSHDDKDILFLEEVGGCEGSIYNINIGVNTDHPRTWIRVDFMSQQSLL
jgi:AAA+ ATPase superfamily predicted ATPase